MNSGWKNVFDTSMLLVIAYSCLTTVYYVSFSQEISQKLKYFDFIVTALFSFDFLFNLC